ncbi:MAG: hypothetical protein WCV59_00645 [Parcubacteria group bacterium]|jgi:hypothetical protein
MENQEPKNEDFNEDFEEGGAKQWLRDNLRIIISVLIVVVIAGGIYSYSKRSATPELAGNNDQGNVLEQIAGTSDNKEEGATNEESGKAAEESNGTTSNQQAVQSKPADQVTSSATSQETDKSFVETASRGDGTTKLARRALANYLEKNPDSALTAEHKIYIEDYLRKRVAKKGTVRIGTSVEFEKGLIQEAISKSKNLNDKQLQNLHKYSVRVASFS